jgi:hypothetical protein
MAINIKPSHQGLLHKRLGIPLGQPIPVSLLRRAAASKDPSLRKQAQFALNARKFKH